MTWSGGEHIIFRQPKGMAIGNGTNKLGAGVDIKANGGYVVAPGSVIDGKPYVVRDDSAIAEAPQWLVELCQQVKPKSPDAGKRVAEETEDGVERARQWLTKHAPQATQGDRDNTGFDVAVRLGDFVLELATLRELLSEWNETKCHPPLDNHDIDRIARSGLKNRRKPIGVSVSLEGVEPVEIEDRRSKLILSSKAFTDRLVPPDYLIDGLVSRQYIYSFTAPTGAGKTAIALLFAARVALGQELAGREIEKGRVLYFAGENSTDVQMRWIAMSQHMHFDRNTIDVHFVDGVVPINEVAPRLNQEIKDLGGVDCVIVDTAAAYFQGDDDNNNVQMLEYAKQLRAFTKLECGPAVLVLCHPVKNASNENLLPRGGGAFLNEMDGNLTASKNDAVSTLHWQGKFRGPDFEPIAFQICEVTTPELRDSKGRELRTVISRPLNAAEQARIEHKTRSDEDTLLITMLEHRGCSVSGFAMFAGWVTSKGEPHKSKTSRILKRLKTDKLVRQERGSYTLTKLGEKAARAVPKVSESA